MSQKLGLNIISITCCGLTYLRRFAVNEFLYSKMSLIIRIFMCILINMINLIHFDSKKLVELIFIRMNSISGDFPVSIHPEYFNIEQINTAAPDKFPIPVWVVHF